MAWTANPLTARVFVRLLSQYRMNPTAATALKTLPAPVQRDLLRLVAENRRGLLKKLPKKLDRKDAEIRRLQTRLATQSETYQEDEAGLRVRVQVANTRQTNLQQMVTAQAEALKRERTVQRLKEQAERRMARKARHAGRVPYRSIGDITDSLLQGLVVLKTGTRDEARLADVGAVAFVRACRKLRVRVEDVARRAVRPKLPPKRSDFWAKLMEE